MNVGIIQGRQRFIQKRNILQHTNVLFEASYRSHIITMQMQDDWETWEVYVWHLDGGYVVEASQVNSIEEGLVLAFENILL